MQNNEYNLTRVKISQEEETNNTTTQPENAVQMKNRRKQKELMNTRKQ